MEPSGITARTRTTAGALALAVATTTLGAGVISASPAAAAAAAVTIDAPVAPRAGTVDLTGSVGVAPGEVTTVLYVFDATSSTASPAELDCSGDGALGPEDDLNQDQSVGDILDCEIAGIGSLNRSLAASSGLQAGMVAFANQAAVADLDPVGSATFVPPGFTGGDPSPRIDTVAGSVVRDHIGLYDPRDLGGSGAGTAFNSAISVALSTLGTAPAGPKWIMFLSDGQAAIDDALLGQLAQSGVHLRSFDIGADATCASTGSLYKMAEATGESCQTATQPASLAAGLTGSLPDALNGVSVTIGGVAVAATVDAFGGWKASFGLGAGTYTATVRAVLASGVTRSAQRTFTVAAAPTGPAPGTVTPGPGALAATVVNVAQPKPSRDVLPPRVSGRVGRPVNGLTVAPSLSGAAVLLQARSSAGAPWTTVDRAQVDAAGRFALEWNPVAGLRLLRVALQPTGGFAGSAAAVPTASISACKVAGQGRWTVTCLTTAKAGSVVRLLLGRKVTDKVRVRRGSFHLVGKGKVDAHRIDIKVGKRHHIRLAL